MFFKARKHKRVADAVLGRVQPFLSDVNRLTGVTPAQLVSDNYLLGFFCANIGIEMRRVANGALSSVEQGTILFLVLGQLFGRGAVNERKIGDLLNGVPTVDDDFGRGSDAALKIQAAASGRHKLANDSDYIAAREVVRKQGDALDFLTPGGASEDSKIAGEMLRALYYQHVIDRHQKPAPAIAQEANEKIKWAQDAAYSLIMTQLDIGGALEDERAMKEVATPYCLGYIFGFSNALFQRAGIGDETAALAQLTVIYVRLFGTEQGSKVLRASLNLQREPDFIGAREVGGTDVSHWLASRAEPLGLADRLHGRR